MIPKRVLQTLIIFQFTLIIAALYIIWKTPPASSYELSIYWSLSLGFWLFIITSILISIGIIIISAIFRINKTYWKLGILSLFISYLIILILPTFRGYVLYGRGSWDILSHIGWTKSILYTKHIDIDDFYPVVHILLAELKYISNLPLNIGSLLISSYFSLLYIVFILVCSKTISKTENQMLFILALASPLFFSFYHISIYPSLLSFFTVPLILYLFHKIESENFKKIKFAIIEIIMIFLIIFFHPMTAIIVLVIMFVFKILEFIQIYYFKITRKFNFIKLLLLTVGLFAWVFSFYRGLKYIKRVHTWLLYGTQYPSLMISYTSLASQINLNTSQIIWLISIKYGGVFLYLILSILCLMYVVKRVITGKLNTFHFEFVYGFQFIVGLFFAIALFIGYSVEFNPLRIIRYPLLMAIFLCGITLYDFFNFNILKSRNSKRTKYIIVIFILAIVWLSTIMGIFNLYPSPLIYEPNQQLTKKENEGTRWFLEKRNTAIELTATAFNLRKYENYYFGFTLARKNRGPWNPNPIPSHFGYDIHKTSLDNILEKSCEYIITFEYNKKAYLAFPKNIQPLVHKYLNNDFKLLHLDNSVNKVYENTGFECWLINSFQSP